MSADKDACWGTTNSETFNEKCRMLHARFQFLSLSLSLFAVVAVLALSQRRFGQLDNFRYEREHPGEMRKLLPAPNVSTTTPHSRPSELAIKLARQGP